MKPPRTPRPAPRTLAGTPPPMVRAPRASSHQICFPTIAVALAGGVVLPACEAPQCGDTRGDELEQHGSQSLRALGEAHPGEALREIGVALGVVSHSGSTWSGRNRGAIAGINVVPPHPTPPDISIQGGPMQVTPEPPPQVVPQRPTTLETPPQPGAPMPVTLHAPVAPRAPHVTPPPPRRLGGAPPPVQPQGAMRGDVSRVSPLPVDLTNARTSRG